MRISMVLVAVSLLGCGAGATSAAPEPASTRQPAAAPDAGAPKPDRLTCADRWLGAKGLNEYGDPKDTAYAGGTPLFDEATGETKDRLAHLLAKHPELASACP